MKKMILSALFSLICLGLLAQHRDISFTVGVAAPMHKNVEGGGVTVNMTYSQYFATGLGFKAGAQFIPTFAEVDNHLSFPVAVAYRTRTRSTTQRLESAAYGAAEGVAWGIFGGQEAITRNLVAGFLAHLFSNAEYFIGLSPGYIGGASSSIKTGSGSTTYTNTWTEKKLSPSLTADAGVSLNYGIGPVDIKLIPAFHYNLTGNLVQHSETFSTSSETPSSTALKPLRWAFTFSAGLGIRF